MKRVGIYAGTFDPVHQGHILFALVAAKAVGLQSVIFIPEPKPRNKTQVTNLDDRLAMLKLAIKKYSNLEVAKTTDEQFTISKTLPQLQRNYGDIVLLLGSDVAKTIQNWPNKERLFKEVELVIGLRDEDSHTKIKTLLDDQGAIVSCIPSPVNIASSRRIRLLGDDEYLDKSVANYITTKQLYILAPPAN